MLNKIVEVLAPTLEARQIREEIANTRKILETETLAPYRTTVEAKLFVGPRPFKSSQVVKINSLIARTLPNYKNNNFVETVTLVLSNISAGYDQFERFAEHTIKGTVIDKLGMSYRKGTILQLLGLMDFVCYYSRSVLLYTFGKEVKNFKSQSGMPEPFSASEIKYLEKHAENYARCLQIFSQPMAKIMATVETVPDIVYDPSKEAAVLAQVGNRLDPLRMGYVPVVSDVIMFFGLRFAEKRALRYLKAEADKKALELRISQYRAAVLNQPDAVTDKMILAAEDELKQLDYDLKEMRKKMGIDE